MKRPSRLNALLASAAVAVLALAAAPAFAQSPVPEEEEIVVTGSRTAERSATFSATPVDVIGGEELTKAGAVGGELGLALQSTAPSFNFPRQSNSGPADLVRAAQLRGLSPDQVLVLVNGKRRHTTAVVNLESKTGKGTAPVDFNSIPLSAIKRIEVLRDGAGAQYGSDAIAGVINVILDDTAEGGTLTASIGTNYTDFEPIDDYIQDGETAILTASYGIPLGTDGFLRFGAEYKDRASTNRSGFDQIPPDFLGIPQTPANLAFAGRRNYRPGDPDVQDLNVWANGEFVLSGSAVGYGFATYNKREGEGAAFFRYPDGADNVLAVYPNGYLPRTTGDNQDLQVSGGVKGDLGAWSYDVSLNYGANSFDFGVENSLNPSLGTASPRNFFLAGFENSLTALNADFLRDIGAWRFAAGLEYRQETFESTPGDPAAYAAGPLAATRSIGEVTSGGLEPRDAVDVDRDVWGLYLEASTDLTEKLFVDAAVRYEDYSDFGDAVAGKIAARYAVTDDLGLRASASTNFRAPALSQTSFQFATTQFLGTGGLGTVRTVAPTSAIGRALGAKPLDAEEAVSGSIGVTYDRGPFTLTLDVYRTEVDDRITLSERFGGLDTFILARTGIAGVTDVNFFTNAADTRTDGADLVVTYARELFSGDLNLSAGYSYAETELRNVKPISPELAALGVSGGLVDVEERNTLTTASPNHKFTVNAQWEREKLGLSTRITRFGETERVFPFAEQKYDGVTQVDVEGEYRFTDRFSLAVGANNLFDQYPDRSNDGVFYFGNFPYDVVSPIGINGAYYYARATVNF